MDFQKFRGKESRAGIGRFVCWCSREVLVPIFSTMLCVCFLVYLYFNLCICICRQGEQVGLPAGALAIVVGAFEQQVKLAQTSLCCLAAKATCILPLFVFLLGFVLYCIIQYLYCIIQESWGFQRVPEILGRTHLDPK